MDEEKQKKLEDAGYKVGSAEEFLSSADELLPCSACSGPLVLLGTLGDQDHFRCRNCGMDTHRTREYIACARCNKPGWRVPPVLGQVCMFCDSQGDLPPATDADLEAMDSQELIEYMGWDEDSQLCHYEAFLSSKGLHREYCEFLLQKAKEENYECGK